MPEAKPRRKVHERKQYDTRLDRWLYEQRVSNEALADASGMSRQNLGKLRAGRRNARQDTIARLVMTLRRMFGKPVNASDLFYLGEERDDNTPEARQFLADNRESLGWQG